MASTPFALQLYTVRDALDQEVAAALAAVRSAGYTCVELAGTHGLGVKAFKQQLDVAGLSAISAHMPFEEIVGQTDRVITEARLLGIDYVVVPWLGGEDFAAWQAWEAAAKKLDAAGAALREAGICLCYHNHAHEFSELQKVRPYDVICENAAPENLSLQLDICWAALAGEDIFALMRRLAGRLPILHLKDYAPGEPPSLTELGRGCLPWDEIFACAREIGIAWNVVEQDDNFTVDSLDSARVGAQFMLARSA